MKLRSCLLLLELLLRKKTHTWKRIIRRALLQKSRDVGEKRREDKTRFGLHAQQSYSRRQQREQLQRTEATAFGSSRTYGRPRSHTARSPSGACRTTVKDATINALACLLAARMTLFSSPLSLRVQRYTVSERIGREGTSVEQS